MSGVYHGVGPAYLQSYVDEYVFRYNAARSPVTGPRGVFDALLSRVSKGPHPAST